MTSPHTTGRPAVDRWPPTDDEPTGDTADAAGADGGLVGDSVRIAVAVALSRLTGLLRVTVAAAALGSTVLGDLFIAVNVLPLTLYDIVAGSAITSILVPPLTRLRRTDRAAGRRLAGNALGLVVVGLAAVAGLVVVGRAAMAGLLTSGVDPGLADDARRVGAVLVLLIAPQLVAYGAIGVLVSIQHAHGRFLLPSAAPIVENLGLLATIAIVGVRYGGGLDVDTAPPGLITTLGIGSGLSVAAHVAVQYVGARRAQGPLSIGLRWRDDAVRALARPARTSFGWSSVVATRKLALVVAATYAGAGGVQALELATLLYFVPLALVGRPIASAALPRLAAAEPSAQLAGYVATVRLAAWLVVPAGAALAALSGPIAGALAAGRFDQPATTTMIAAALVGLAIGAVSEALFEVGRQAAMARGRSETLRPATWIRALTAVVGLPVAVVALDGPAVLMAIGLVVSIGDLAALFLVHRALRRDPAWPGPTEPIWHRLGLVTALTVGPAAAVSPLLGGLGDEGTLAGAALVAVTGFAAGLGLLARRGRLVLEPIRALGTELSR